jgi:asparagine synthase (glutamine-hydrolysing)
MCGISGFFSAAPLVEGEELNRLGRMRDALAHRGPDGHGRRMFGHAALVHNRLAIIDLETGQQPLTSASGSAHVVFNGEIYNFRELRAQLGDYPFRTRSDTEVILALYEKEGPAGWRRLRGMYAFALWDEARQCGYLARDPMGIKPLFFAEVDRRLVFGSEAKALLAYGFRAVLDPGALHQLMNFRYVAGDGSLFDGVRQLEAAALLEWCPQGIDLRPRFLAAPERPQRTTRGALAIADVDDLGARLERAVAGHLVSDVPVGCYLSGGIDSAVIAKLASAHTPLSSYTLEAGDDPAEADHAADTAAWLGIENHRQALVAPDVVGMHRALVRHLEVPKVNAVQGMVLAEFAARHVKVALSGIGGDELFYGYNAHRIMWLAAGARRLLPGGSNRVLASLLSGFGSSGDWSERSRSAAMLAAMPDWARVYGLLRNVWDAPQMRRDLYGERLLDARLPQSFAWLAERFPEGQDPVAAMAAFEMENKLVNDLLWNEDRVAMRVGLECRVPFLDADLVEHLRSRPRDRLMPFGRKKYLLRRYAKRILPAAILKRPKSGFQLDITGAAQSFLKPLFDTYLSEERTRAHRLFNHEFVARVRQAPPRRGMRWHWFVLYLMAQTHLLMEEFHVS